MSTKTVIPIFYASDENYLPYLTVSVYSLKENASKNYRYELYVLHAGMDIAKADELKKYEEDGFEIHFVDVSEKMENVKNSLHLRDYYTGATYYRIFIAELFPQYEKALYLDGDTILLGDVSELFETSLGETLIGAVPDEAVASVPEFRIYTKEVLGIGSEKYFNAGVILMNLAQLRKENFYQSFCELLKKYKFSVAQDQDYLNVICKDKVTYIGAEWNRMPIGEQGSDRPKLIHYNLTMKPWHYENVLYKESFWQYARRTEFYQRILNDLAAYSQEKRDADAASEKALIQLCVKEAEREDNYLKRFGK